MLEPSSVSADKNLHAFEPSADRAAWLDRRMRLRLAESLRYILAQADGSLGIAPEQSERFLARIELQPVSPLAFSFYSEAVLAIEGDDIGEASRLFGELIELPAHPGGPAIIELGDPRQDRVARRYAGFLDADPSVPFAVFPPSPEAARSCRAQIHDAFALMESGDPALAAEIRTLLREIVLAAGSEDPKAMTFDGASAFMLWGAIIINANRRDGAVGMVQMLAHESAHNLLFGFSADGPLVENSAEELYSSPLRVDPRPMDGIYHATFVTARMHRAIKQLLDSGVLDSEQREKAARDLEDNARLFHNGFETVKKHGRLTPVGQTVMQGASEYMAAVS
jgi:HEXXH motif-containing protein